jgi:hypothetical protein
VQVRERLVEHGYNVTTSPQATAQYVCMSASTVFASSSERRAMFAVTMRPEAFGKVWRKYSAASACVVRALVLPRRFCDTTHAAAIREAKY